MLLPTSFIVFAPAQIIEALSGTLCALFLAAAILRLLSACFTNAAPKRPARIEDARLPIYTIICALYREAAVVKDLVAAIRALDYPPEKLDVKFVLEADDRETRRAVAALNLGPPFEIIIAPRSVREPSRRRSTWRCRSRAAPTPSSMTPKTRRKPISCAARLMTFRDAGNRLACLQASLTIDNTADNWLSRMFTANYAGQFDVFLPGLAALHLPFPLGGSSNHFRTAVLRKVGGWDPYNVTEDADLGIRLCRLGYRSAALASATYEEAPARFVPWLAQRTRWYKGWMQTWLVHMRRPARLFRELGTAGAIAFQIFLAANVLAALIHPLFMAGLGYTLCALPTPWASAIMDHAAPIFATSLFSGYASTIVLDLIGLRRRGLLGSCLGARADAAALVPAVARRMARGVPAHLRSTALGKNRARAGEDLPHRTIAPCPIEPPPRAAHAADRAADAHRADADHANGARFAAARSLNRGSCRVTDSGADRRLPLPACASC